MPSHKSQGDIKLRFQTYAEIPQELRVGKLENKSFLALSYDITKGIFRGSSTVQEQI